MSDFHKEDEHKAFSLLFDSSKIEESYKAVPNVLPCFVVSGKDEKRIESMFNSAVELNNGFKSHHSSSIAIICMARNFEEGVMMKVGLLPYKVQGISICTACLSKAIATCEEQLEVLRDLEKLAMDYAAKL